MYQTRVDGRFRQLLPAETRRRAAQAKGLRSLPVSVVRALISATSGRTAIVAIGQAGPCFALVMAHRAVVSLHLSRWCGRCPKPGAPA
jgi:hypothetical protein